MERQRMARRYRERIIPTLELDYILCLRTLLPGGDFELYRVTFLQALVTLGLNRRVMNEHICAIVLSNEPVALTVVEPLHFSCYARQLSASQC